LEPLEATSIAFIEKIQRSAYDIWNGNKSAVQANNEYKEHIREVEIVLMMHYAAGSPFKTEFWDFAQERGIRRLEEASGDTKLKQIYQAIRSLPNKDAKALTEVHLSGTLQKLPEHGNWWHGSYIENIEGLGVSGLFDRVFLD
jgi:hypothetical protein